MRIKVNPTATLISKRNVVAIRGEDGATLGITPALACELAKHLPIGHAEAMNYLSVPPNAKLTGSASPQ